MEARGEMRQAANARNTPESAAARLMQARDRQLSDRPFMDLDAANGEAAQKLNVVAEKATAARYVDGHRASGKHSLPTDGARAIQEQVATELAGKTCGAAGAPVLGAPVLGAEAWMRIRQQLQAKLGKEAFTSWFGCMHLESFGDGAVLHTVPTAFLKSWISSRYGEQLLEMWSSEEPGVSRVEISVRNAARRSAPANAPANRQVRTKSAGESANPAATTQAANQPTATAAAKPAADRRSGFAGSPLDPRYTFDSFVDGAANRMAYAAARTVAEDEGKSVRFNPLFIHAGVGLGKTHLLQAIANHASTRNPRLRVLYLTAEFFMFRFAAAIRDNTALSLKETIRGIDLLLIDDMQFLQGKTIQAEFCHLLNELIDSARHVVVAADRPPAELESLDERVRSRLKGGVAFKIEAPDYEMRKALLMARLAAARREQPTIDISDEIIEYVARQVTTSGRDLEGAFNQLLVQCKFSENSISFDELDKLLGHLIKASEVRRVRIEDIQRIVARHYNVSKNDLLSSRRTRTIVRPRQVAMFLAKALTPRSLPEIGRRFGGRDHTTVLHAVRKIESLLSSEPKLTQEIELLKRLINE